MKHITAILVLITVSFSAMAQADVNRLWDEANTAYVNMDYRGAIAGYDSLLRSGYTGYKLYYNIANAYFKDGQTGKAILFYNRAHKLRPGDSDIKHNLKVAGTQVRDKIEALPEFFLTTWFRAWRLSVSSNNWAALSLIFLTVVLGAVLLYLLSRRMVYRKAGFYTALGGLFLVIISIFFSVRGKKDLLDGGEAIIMISAAPVKSSPEYSGKDIFILHEGTKVKIVRKLEEWTEIMIPDGNKGWISELYIETI